MSLKNAVLRGEDASMEEVWEGVLWRMAVQAVPTLLSCLAFMSFSPLFFVSSIPFSVLFVTLSVLISVASWCWSPTEGGGASVTTTDNNKCKLGTRSWWCCGEAPRGFQLAMLVLTWALLLLLLCMPLMAKAEIGQVDHAVTQDLDDEGQEIVAQVLKESGVDTGAESGDAEKRPDEEPQSHQQSSFDSSADSSPQSELLPSCRTLVRLGEQVTCAAAPPALSSPAPKYVSSEFGATSTLCGQHPVFPPFLLFGQQPLHQSQVAFLTIMNSCNGSRLSLLVARSDTRQFFVDGGLFPKLLAPGGAVKLPVCYLPEHLGGAKGSIVVETSSQPLVVQVQGEGVPSLYKLQVRVQENSLHSVISLFNPFDETLFVEEAVVVEEEEAYPSEEEVVVEAQEECGDDGHGLMMRGAATWALPGQSSRDILEFTVCLNQGEVFRGSFHIRVTTEEDQDITLVYRFSSRVSRPSRVVSVPHMLDFGMLVGDQANSQLLVLHNSGQQVVQIEDIYELSGDSKLKIDYEKGQILRPNSKKEVANVTYSGQNQSVTCMKAQKIIVHTNSTIDHLIEIPYTAMVLQCLHSPPAMAFGTGSPGSAGDLGGSQQLGFTDLLMNGKVVFMGLVICVGLICGLIFFHPVVLDANLPTFSNECHGRSPLIMKKRDKITKMRGWGALATVADGVWTAFGSSLWTNKDCTTPAPDYTLPRFVTPPSSPASPSAATTASKKGKKGRKNNNNAAAAKSGLPFTSNHHHHHHHGPSVYQPKASKFLRPENPAKHLVYADQHVKDDVALAPVVPEAEPGSPVADPKPDAPIEEPAKKTLDVLTATGTPLEKRKRKKKSNKCSHLGTISPASPSSPVAPSWFSSPPSPGKKSDQSSSPRSVDLAVPELKVKILHSPTKVTDSPKMEPPQPPRKQPLPFERPRVLPRKNEPAPAPVLAPRKKAPASTGYFHRSLFTEPTDYDGSQTFRRPHPQPITAFGAAPGSPYRRDSEAFVAPPPPLAPPPPPPPRPLPSPIARPKKHESWASLGITEDGQPPLYDIWGNYFGDLDLDALSEPLEYPHPPLQPGEISPIGAALYASGFQSYFSEPGTFDFHPAPPAPLPASPAPLPAPQVAVKPFVKPPPYTPPMGGPNRYYPLAFNPQQSNIWAFDSSTDYNNNNNNNWASDYSGGGGSSSSSGGTRRRVPESRVPPPSLPPYNQPPYKW